MSNTSLPLVTPTVLNPGSVNFGSATPSEKLYASTIKFGGESVATKLARPSATDRVRTGSSGATVNNDGTIVQSERLFTARPRYVPNTKKNLYWDSLATRGTHARIKLLTDSSQAAKYKTQSGSRGNNALVGENSPASIAASSDSSLGYDSFLITSVSCAIEEKMQVTEVLGDGEVAYFFGRQPIQMRFSGMIVDSPDNNWFATWLGMYSDFLRGTQLAQNYELVRLVLPNMVLTGTIFGTSFEQESNSDVAVSFSFSFLVKTMEALPATGQAVSSAVTQSLIDFSKAVSFIDQQKINSLKSQSAYLVSVVQNPASSFGEWGSALSNWGQGVGGSIANLGKKVQDFTTNNPASKALKSVSGMFRTVSATLDGVRAQIFSPIYGIMSSLTRLVRNTYADVMSIFNSITTPIRNVLRDITNIANQIKGLVGMVTAGIKGIGRAITGGLKAVKSDFDKAIKEVGKAAGAVAMAPMSVAQSVQTMFQTGVMNASSPFIQANPKSALSKSVLISKGPAATASKIALLHSGAKYSASSAARL